MEQKHYNHGHRIRLKNRFKEKGLDAFEDHEILELLLFYCIPRKNTNEIAHRLLNEFGSLSNLFESSVSEIIKRGKLTENTAILFTLIPQLSKRYVRDKWGRKPTLDEPQKAGEFAVTLFLGKVYEAFYILCLDTQNKLLHSALIEEGTIDEAKIYPRLVVEAALLHQASGVILAHNHPGGSLKPSAGDLETTKMIVRALDSIGITVVDHIIASGEDFYSFAENGHI